MTCAILQDWTHYSFTTALFSFSSYDTPSGTVATVATVALAALLQLVLLLLLLLLLMTPAAANSTRQSTNHNCNLGCWFRRPLMSRKFCGCCSKDTLQQENFTGNGCLVTFSKPYVDDRGTKHVVGRKHQHLVLPLQTLQGKVRNITATLDVGSDDH